jgi:hypothetical protein
MSEELTTHPEEQIGKSRKEGTTNRRAEDQPKEYKKGTNQTGRTNKSTILITSGSTMATTLNARWHHL